MTVIRVTENGPYRVEGPLEVVDVDGVSQLVEEGYLCRCGGSRNKPFCDATHGLKHFDGAESASHDDASDRQVRYQGDDGDILDDRSRCAHWGQCTRRLPAVFDNSREPWIQARAAGAEAVSATVLRCPSGALAQSRPGQRSTDVAAPAARAEALEDGPLRLSGPVTVVGADGRPYDARPRQTLCRCGQSSNKPFCDGSHWYAGFRDPLPPELAELPTPYEWLGGLDALEHLTSVFYDGILTEPDELLEPVFRGMDPGHPKHVAAWLGEVLGGPATYTEHHGGYQAMVTKHHGLRLTEEQRRRWVERIGLAADQVGLPSDPDFRAAFLSYVEWGTRIAVANSGPEANPTLSAPVPT